MFHSPRLPACSAGVAYTFVLQNQTNFAGDLVHALVASNQPVPKPLHELAMKARGRTPSLSILSAINHSFIHLSAPVAARVFIKSDTVVLSIV
eukprot:scaffold363657_cov31-Prasinocladus_malaysianus.AAC.1